MSVLRGGSGAKETYESVNCNMDSHPIKPAIGHQIIGTTHHFVLVKGSSKSLPNNLALSLRCLGS